MTERYELRDDVPPAPGRWRGGLGIVRTNRFTGGGAFTSETDRAKDAPTGLFGGHGGTTLRLTKIDADGTEREIPSKQTNFTMEPGAVLRWEQACGGGYGPPLERDAEAVLRDWRDEFRHGEDAAEHYGVVIDTAADAGRRRRTERLRAERGAA
jgi:N-methylhydantoinase B